MFQVVERPKLYEQVVEQIKSMIEQGLYKKGDLLPSEKELIDMMGVSRITVREALRLLNEAGVIETHKGKGSFVLVDREELLGETDRKKDYREHFLHATEVRILLEPAIVRELAATASEEELEEIITSFEERKQGKEEFHWKIVYAAHNPILTQWFEELEVLETAPTIRSLVPPVQQKSVVAQITQQHRDICEALRSRDGEFAYFYMKEHLKYIKSIYEQYFDVFY